MKKETHRDTKKWAKWTSTLLFIPTWLLVTGIFQLLALQINQFLLDSDIDLLPATSSLAISRLLFIQIAMLFSGVGTTFLFWTLIQKRKFKEIGLKCSFNDFKNGFWGFLTGIILIALIVFVLLLTGNVKINYIGIQWQYLKYYLFLFLLVAFNEELVSRGFLLGNLSRLMNKYVAVFIVALLFSLAHFFNPNINLMGKLNILIAGILLGLPYIYTNSLWFSIGLHFSWNFFLGPIVGSNVSGNEIYHPACMVKYSGNEIVTGGKFGFEGSIVLTITAIFLIVALGFYFERKKRMMPATNY